MSFSRLSLVFTVLAVLTLSGLSRGVTIDWVTVGDPGNTADATGYGAVAEEFRIGKYEVTIRQYTEFLNAVAATDRYSLYNTSMGTDLSVAGIARSGASGSYTYSVIGPSGNNPTGASSPGNRPVSYISWFDAARFANWMHNGQGAGGTETGAYTLYGFTSGPAPVANPDAQFYIPTENQWYKAAYYKGGGADAGYWSYATQSDVAPGNTIGSGANQANFRAGSYAVTGSVDYSASQNYLTDVGAFTNSPSGYGTFDQNGNVYEWNDLTGVTGSDRGLRGGYWSYSAYYLSSASRLTYSPSNEFGNLGFRLASPVPESPLLRLVVGSGVETQSELGYPVLTTEDRVVKLGLGTLVLDAANTFTSWLAVEEGTLVAANARAVGNASLEVVAGATFAISPEVGATLAVELEALGEISGRIDVGVGRFSLPATAETPATVLRDLLVSGRNGSSWDGAVGIVSTAIAESAETRAVGYIVASDGSAVVAFAAPGDTNLNGQVDVFDLIGIDSSGTYGTGQTAVWSQGDFNYDGMTNIFDLVGVDAAGIYGQGNYLPSAPASIDPIAVPEPTGGALVLVAFGCVGYRIHRSSRKP